MREDKVLDLIGEIDSKYIEEAKFSPKISLVKWGALVACIALCLCGSMAGVLTYQAHNTAVSYICLDVNPSFELCLNRENRVINAIAYNEDGKEFLNKFDYKNKNYEEVINDMLHNDEFQEYLTEDLTITIISNDDDQIQQCIERYMKSAQCNGKVLCSDSQTREKASSNHCSVGKYIAYQNLSQYDPDVTLEECQGMTMHEIYEEIDKHHNAHHSNQNKQDYDNGEDSHSNHHSDHH